MISIGNLMVIFAISIFVITSMYILYTVVVTKNDSYIEGFDKDKDKKDKEDKDKKDKALPLAPSPLFATPSPAPSPLFAAPSPAPSPLFATPSPAPSPLFATPSSAPSPLFATPSPVPSPLFATPSPAPSPLITVASPAPSPLFATPSPAPSPLFATPSPVPSPLFATPSPAPSPLITVASPAPAPIFVTPAFGASATLSVSNQSNYQEVEKQQPISQKINYESKNPPYAETRDDQPSLSTSRGGKMGDLQTGFIEKKAEEVQSTLERDSQKSVPYEGKITSTPAPIETARLVDVTIPVIKKVPAESSSAIVIETLNNEKITFVLPSVFPSIYRTGIDLIKKEFTGSDKNIAVSIPYSIAKISVPNGYSVYIETLSQSTNKTEVYNTIEEGVKTSFSTPIEINPKKYRYVIMYISPRN